MPELVSHRIADGVATITMDDGKVNALSPPMLAGVDAALDRAEADGAVVVLTGRPGVFSAGFDLGVLAAGGPDAVGMLRQGFELAERLLSFPRPVVVACSGHALAMGSFLLLSGDLRIGVEGDRRIAANEVAIGLTMPRAAIEILRQRLTPAHFVRATLLAETFAPEDAIAAGFLDRIVAPEELGAAAREAASQLTTLDAAAHAATKLRARSQLLAALRSAIEADQDELQVPA